MGFQKCRSARKHSSESGTCTQLCKSTCRFIESFCTCLSQLGGNRLDWGSGFGGSAFDTITMHPSLFLISCSGFIIYCFDCPLFIAYGLLFRAYQVVVSSLVPVVALNQDLNVGARIWLLLKVLGHTLSVQRAHSEGTFPRAEPFRRSLGFRVRMGLGLWGLGFRLRRA